MNERIYKVNKELKRIDSLATYKGIKKEISSFDKRSKGVVYSILMDLYENKPMWGENCQIEMNALCDPRDTFDETKGKEICNIKSDLKYHQMLYNRYLSIYWTISILKMRIEKIMRKHQEKIERLERDLNQYVK
jgi:hypothetical protein